MGQVPTNELAAELLRLTLPLMSRYKVPVTPTNYALWYEYVSGGNQSLSDALDKMIKAGESIGEGATRELYQRYVLASDEALLQKIRDSLHEVLGDLGTTLETTNRGVSRYQDTLDGCGEKLSPEATLQELRGIVDTLVRETRVVREVGSQFQHQLEESRRETEALRKELERVKHEATRDALTGLANRKEFFRVLEEAVLEARRNEHDLCLIIGDIDHFKRINDTHGHLLGDKVIRFVAATLKQCVKGRDLVARYGGEEFAVLLQNTPYVGALSLADGIRRAVEGGRLVKANSRESIGVVTISLGVARFEEGERGDDFVERADTSLYRSKELGRNRVTGEHEA